MRIAANTESMIVDRRLVRKWSVGATLLAAYRRHVQASEGYLATYSCV